MTISSSVSLTVMSVSLVCAVPADVKASSTEPSLLVYYILFLILFPTLYLLDRSSRFLLLFLLE